MIRRNRVQRQAARAQFGALPPVEGFRNVAGRGVTGLVEGHRVEVDRGTVLVDGAAAGRLSVADSVKPTSAEAIADLRALGLTPVLVTGDSEENAVRVAREVGVERVVAGVLPDQKAEEVRRLEKKRAKELRARDEQQPDS